MELYESVDRPALEPGLVERLKRIDPRLRVTFSHYVIDYITSAPVEDLVTGGPIVFPAQHLWRKGEGSRWHHLGEFPMGEGGFSHLNARFLEIDRCVVHSSKPEEIMHRLHERQELLREKNRAANHDLRHARALANKRRIGDLVFEGKSGRRQAKVASYPGQTNRGTPGDVLPDAREDGWEL